jgi:thiol-disulfide isomerase/thioredoxin
MKKILFLIVIYSCSWVYANAQDITCNFPLLKNQTIRLIGFNGKENYTIDSAIVSEQGDFKLHYTKQDYGMAYITGPENKPYILVLEKDDIELKGENISNPESISILKGPENMAFVRYAKEHATREQALSAWSYLKNMYELDALFLNMKTAKQSILTEMNGLKKQDSVFLGKLPKSSYVSWYLPTRKLISDVATIAQYRTSEIPATINAFRKINYADPRLYKSGLFNDVFESHYWLLENRGLASDTMFTEMNISTDAILERLVHKDSLYNEITNLLFDYFEKHSLFASSEYIALKALSQNKIVLNGKLAKKLESYRTMKKGNIAPNILFNGDVYKNGFIIKSPSSLLDLTAKYKLVIFGASWCPSCASEMAQLLPQYQNWKAKGVEVVFVSLDTDKSSFYDFTQNFPFISVCDYQKWETKAAKDYFVSSSPTFYLLDQQNNILSRPNSVDHISALINYYSELNK